MPLATRSSSVTAGADPSADLSRLALAETPRRTVSPRRREEAAPSARLEVEPPRGVDTGEAERARAESGWLGRPFCTSAWSLGDMLPRATRRGRSALGPAVYRHGEGALADVASISRPDGAIVSHQHGKLVDARHGHDVPDQVASVAHRLHAELLLSLPAS